MNKKALLIIGIVIVVAVVAVVLLTRTRVPDMAGTFRLKNGGEGAAVMQVTLDDSVYTINLTGAEDLHATYQVKKTMKNELIFADECGGNKTGRYELKRTNRGFEGTVWVLPIGKADVVFEKIED